MDQFVSETGWNGSGGGVSAYESMPTYQEEYGLTTLNALSPTYLITPTPLQLFQFTAMVHGALVGGTSAGAPQWAAIHALGLSAFKL